MLTLTAENVSTTIKKCLFTDEEDMSVHVKAEGVIRNYGFHPERLKAQESQIVELLNQLPAVFHQGTGDGCSFLAACEDRNGNLWGQHTDIEALMCMGIAIKRVQMLMPRNMWPLLPGGMPYFVVLKEPASG